MSTLARNKLRTLLFTASILLLVISLLGATVLYQLLNDISRESSNDTQFAQDVINDLRRTEVTFKMQVQEWKDMLLRQYDPVLYQKHYDAFLSEHRTVQAMLSDIAAELTVMGFDNAEVVDLNRHHDENLEKYLAALREFPIKDNPRNVSRLDRRVMGMDKELSKVFDKVNEDVGSQTLLFVKNIPKKVSSRYRAKEWFLLVMLGMVIPVTTLVGFTLIHRLSKRIALQEERLQITLREIEHQAFHDQLTGLPNRRALRERMSQAIHSAARNRTQLAILFIDLDKFKYINDTFGHLLGDEMLKEVAGRFGIGLRQEDVVSRTGGDEFAVLLPHINSDADACMVAQKLQQLLSTPVVINGLELRTGASIGISLYPEDGQDLDTLLRHADIAMYHAKQKGGVGFSFFQEEFDNTAKERMVIDIELHRAIERGEFELYYQSKVITTGGRLVGAEALIRWHHPEHGLTLPNRFIPIAEETGVIMPIGDWVAYQTCLQGRLWSDAGIRIPISFNVSARQIQHGDFVQTLAQIVRDTGVDAALIELELTESLLMKPEEVDDILREIKAIGFRVALDDFGTGYSCLSYLNQFKVDTIKIDRSFIHDLAASQDSKAIVMTIINMAKNMRMEVVAEGVDTAEQVKFLANNGCDYCQGYYFDVPQPAGEFRKLLQSRYAVPRLRHRR